MSRQLFWLLFLASASAAAQTGGTTVVIDASRDNTLFSELPENANGSGPDLFLGFTRRGGERRIALAFDDLSAIPADQSITSVTLTLTANRGMGQTIRASLFEATTPWGEGASLAPDPGGEGVPAEPDDATWSHAFYPATFWQTPGGDFVDTPVATANIPETGRVVFSGNAGLTQLVRSWHQGTKVNRGLLLISDSQTLQEAKRIGSREQSDPNSRPFLTVTLGDAQAANFSGLWFDPETDGEGFNIIANDAGVTIFFYGYDTNGGRLWLVSETLLEPLQLGQTASFPLLVADGPGNFFNPATPDTLRSYGQLDVTLASCDAGFFVITGDDGIKMSDVVRLATAGQACATSVIRQSSQGEGK